MARYALLVGSPRSVTGAFPIQREIVDNNLNAISETLSTLGSHSFTWPGSRAPQRSGANKNDTLRKLDIFRKTKIKEEDVFLFYYFGHGFMKGDELCLAFEQLHLDRETTPCHLSTILTEVNNAGFRKIVVIIDCCHAGSSGAVTFTLRSLDYCLLTSSSNSWARFTESGGIFTRALTDALSYKSIRSGDRSLQVLRDPRYGGITLASWFNYAKDQFDDIGQQPCSSGSLLTMLLLPDELKVTPALNPAAPRKSLYFKIFSILNVLAGKFKSIDTIYATLEKLRPPEFLVNVTENGGMSDRLVTSSKIREYLELATSLGFTEIDGGERWKLRPLGRRARERDGAEYNGHLVESIVDQLDQRGLSLEILKESLFSLAERGRVPNILNLERLLLERNETIPQRKLLRLWMRLLGYSGVIQKATGDTYFPL